MPRMCQSVGEHVRGMGRGGGWDSGVLSVNVCHCDEDPTHTTQYPTSPYVASMHD